MIKLTANLSHLFAGNSYNKLNTGEVEDSKKKKKNRYGPSFLPQKVFIIHWSQQIRGNL
jgi:hypothetical protein